MQGPLHIKKPKAQVQSDLFFIIYFEELASLTWTTCFPLQTNNRVLCSSASACLKPDATPPSWGIIHGLKYDKNFSVSWPCTSRYWTARPPRAASSSTVLMAAVPASSYSNISPSQRKHMRELKLHNLIKVWITYLTGIFTKPIMDIMAQGPIL